MRRRNDESLARKYFEHGYAATPQDDFAPHQTLGVRKRPACKSDLQVDMTRTLGPGRLIRLAAPIGNFRTYWGMFSLKALLKSL